MTVACIGGVRSETSASSPTEEPAATSPNIQPAETIEPRPTQTPEPTATTAATEIPAAASQTSVTITAVGGNLYVRRGPDMAFNQVGVLYDGESMNVIARDVFSDWLQVSTGWVSIQTKYSSVAGNISTLPEVEVTEWPTPAYLRNCTYHTMYVLPAEIQIPSYFFKPENKI